MDNRLVNRFLNYIQIDSESGSELEFATYLKSELIEMGFHVVMDDAGDQFGGNCGNLIASLPGDVAGEPLLFSAHMDTVKPGKGIVPIIDNGIIKSDGATILGGDDKAGIAAIMEGVARVLESGARKRGIELVFTVCEEGGINGGKYLNLDLVKSRKGIILDSSKLPGEIITQSPGQARIDVTIHGKAAHAGVCPEDGVSAVEIFSQAVTQMKLGRIDEKTTANIGILEGGTATNIVMPELKATAEVRSLDLKQMIHQVEHMKHCFEAAAKSFGGQVDFHSDIKYHAFHVEDDAEIVLRAKAAFEILGLKATTTFTGGGSDANALNKRGLEMINLGIGEKKAHTLDEHYYIEDLELMSKFVQTLIENESRR